MPTQLIPAGDQLVPLPDGVTVSEWSLEKVKAQNPRLRAFLLCNRMIESILDSNYAILHCSPQRLHEIWRRLTEISETIRIELAPTLDHPSQIPALEAARNRAKSALLMTSRTTLVDLDQMTHLLEAEDLLRLRKRICVSIGKLHSFIQNTFCELIAADPRSLHDSDYFMSKRFPRDIEEAEWLHATVSRLRGYLDRLAEDRIRALVDFRDMLDAERVIPDGTAWDEARLSLEHFRNDLTQLLKETLALRGIRFDEMETLDRYGFEIPAKCQLLLELHASAREVAERLVEDARAAGRSPQQSIHELTASHAVFAERISRLVHELVAMFHDLAAFVPLWIENIENRRALLLERGLQEALDVRVGEMIIEH